MALMTFGFSGDGFLIALTTCGSCTLGSTTFGFSCSLESPVTRGCRAHFILAIASIIVAFIPCISWSSLTLSVLVGGVGLFELRFWSGLLKILRALLVKFGLLNNLSKSSVLLHSDILCAA